MSMAITSCFAYLLSNSLVFRKYQLNSVFVINLLWGRSKRPFSLWEWSFFFNHKQFNSQCFETSFEFLNLNCTDKERSVRSFHIYGENALKLATKIYQIYNLQP